MLQRWHRMPRRHPPQVLSPGQQVWSWSIAQPFAPGVSVRQMAQPPPCLAMRAARSAIVMP